MIVSTVVPVSGIVLMEKTSHPLTKGNILYVGGSGPNNYTKIQDAIDNASVGDTVFVFSGTYYEYIVIDKSVNLIGEDPDTTIIDGDDLGVHTINLVVDRITISHFMIKNEWHGGLFIMSNSSIIEYNIVTDITYDGMVFIYSSNNTIVGNIIKNCNFGIRFFSSSQGNIIVRNTIFNNSYGIELDGSSYNIVTQNNIMKNTKQDATFGRGFWVRPLHNMWNRNYWGEAKSSPKLILGWLLLWSIRIPLINFDWHPAQEPYDIPLQDR
jgi:parallel beta-helix repeat protein